MNDIKSQRIEMLWEEASRLFDVLLGIFPGKKRAAWLKKIWISMRASGLIAYQGKMDKYRVILRLMTLATMYREFCRFAYNREFFREEETMNWIQQDLISALYLCASAQRFKMKAEDMPGEWEYHLVDCACGLIDEMRTEIFEALVHAYHCDHLALFQDMFNIGYSLREEPEDDLEEWLYEDLVERMSRALVWITFGMLSSLQMIGNSVVKKS